MFKETITDCNVTRKQMKLYMSSPFIHITHKHNSHYIGVVKVTLYTTNGYPQFLYQISYPIIRDAPISKLTDIPITNILAIKSTDSDTNTNITTSMGLSLLLLQMLQI